MRRYQGNTILIELIIVILFFSLSMIAIIPVFAGAQQMTSESRARSRAMALAQDIAETLSASDMADEALLSKGFTKTEDGYVLTSPDGFTLTAICARLTQPAGALTQTTIEATRGDETLFTLPVSHYAAKEAE